MFVPVIKKNYDLYGGQNVNAATGNRLGVTDNAHLLSASSPEIGAQGRERTASGNNFVKKSLRPRYPSSQKFVGQPNKQPPNAHNFQVKRGTAGTVIGNNLKLKIVPGQQGTPYNYANENRGSNSYKIIHTNNNNNNNNTKPGQLGNGTYHDVIKNGGKGVDVEMNHRAKTLTQEEQIVNLVNEGGSSNIAQQSKIKQRNDALTKNAIENTKMINKDGIVTSEPSLKPTNYDNLYAKAPMKLNSASADNIPGFGVNVPLTIADKGTLTGALLCSSNESRRKSLSDPDLFINENTTPENAGKDEGAKQNWIKKTLGDKRGDIGSYIDRQFKGSSASVTTSVNTVTSTNLSSLAINSPSHAKNNNRYNQKSSFTSLLPSRLHMGTLAATAGLLKSRGSQHQDTPRRKPIISTGKRPKSVGSTGALDVSATQKGGSGSSKGRHHHRNPLPTSGWRRKKSKSFSGLEPDKIEALKEHMKAHGLGFSSDSENSSNEDLPTIASAQSSTSAVTIQNTVAQQPSDMIPDTLVPEQHLLNIQSKLNADTTHEGERTQRLPEWSEKTHSNPNLHLLLHTSAATNTTSTNNIQEVFPGNAFETSLLQQSIGTTIANKVTYVTSPMKAKEHSLATNDQINHFAAIRDAPKSFIINNLSDRNIGVRQLHNSAIHMTSGLTQPEMLVNPKNHTSQQNGQLAALNDGSAKKHKGFTGLFDKFLRGVQKISSHKAGDNAKEDAFRSRSSTETSSLRRFVKKNPPLKCAGGDAQAASLARENNNKNGYPHILY